MDNEYYYISLQWTRKNNNVFVFWQPNHNGYTHLLEKADNRNKAIYKAFQEWDIDYDTSFIKFKSMVTCKKIKTVVFDKWSS